MLRWCLSGVLTSSLENTLDLVFYVSWYEPMMRWLICIISARSWLRLWAPSGAAASMELAHPGRRPLLVEPLMMDNEAGGIYAHSISLLMLPVEALLPIACDTNRWCSNPIWCRSCGLYKCRWVSYSLWSSSGEIRVFWAKPGKSKSSLAGVLAILCLRAGMCSEHVWCFAVKVVYSMIGQERPSHSLSAGIYGGDSWDRRWKLKFQEWGMRIGIAWQTVAHFLRGRVKQRDSSCRVDYPRHSVTLSCFQHPTCCNP